MRSTGIGALAALLGLGLCWAMRLMAIKAVTQAGLSPTAVALTASLGVAVAMSGINLVRGRSLVLTRKAWRFYAIAGLFGFGAPFLLEIVVAMHLPAVVFVMVVTSAPIFTAAIAIAWRLEAVNWAKGTAIGLGFAASVLVILGGENGMAVRIDALFLGLAVAIPVFYAIYILYIARAWPGALDGLQVAQGQAIVASGAFVLVTLALPGSQWAWPRTGEVGLLALIVVSEAVALILFFQLARSQGGTFAAQANYVAIATGAVLGWVIFDEALTAMVIAGLGLFALALAFNRG